ncbi:glycoside hydrolase family 92 protein [Aulographum hederae CBS 113979]|uniref:Glycoside hydrolase family 92 protein n=1 Tax=Aulographum hederae CBS 113979 TaxID=1176131 RepID=A0A6G1H5H8_9PEZI|nr:glycoside hydrolase family 92 protein [Aulographum hederae CBS 113979]
MLSLTCVFWCQLTLSIILQPSTELVAAQSVKSGFDYVNPLIGTTEGGHVFPGASLPFGMAKAVADVSSENQGGFSSDNRPVMGFSHMHDSGTGGAPSLGNFPIFPQVGCPNDQLNNCNFMQKDRTASVVNGSIEAHPGYFALTLNSSIRAEMTVTNHSAIYRFTFPATGSNNSTSLRPLILAELSDLPNTRSNGSITVDPDTGRITGNGTFEPSFGIGNYDLHFCADFKGARIRETGTWRNNRAGSEPKSQSVQADGVNNSPQILPAGAYTWLEAPDGHNQIFVRVGVSFMGVNQACGNAEHEIPDFDFDGTREDAEATWRTKLDVISIDAGGASEEIQEVFWSGVYRSMLSPQDYTGENPLWDSDEPYYDSYYCIWDSFRSIHQLITLLDPLSQTLMVRSLLDIYRHEGKLPDCRMSLCKGFTQGGSNADIVLADSYLKNITEGVDWALAYEAMLSDAEDEPANWALEGRGGLASWKSLGYIPTDDYDPYGVGPFSRSISRTVEYAYNDFTLSLLASGLGHAASASLYATRSKNWINMYKADQSSTINGTSTGFTGFLQPRYLNGSFGFQDPIFCSPLLNFTSCYLNPDGHETYEGSSWLYTLFAPHDMAALITLLGGPAHFIRRLDFLHEYPGLLYLGDEQAFLTVYLYHFAGAPAKSAARIHSYIPSQFNTSLNGIPGNDDSGAMGSFAALSMMGVFPNPGQDVYFITPPFFREVNVTNGQTGAVATIRNVGFEGDGAGLYVQSARLNGEVYGKNWLKHSFFLEGGVLELTLGRDANSSWGTRVEDLPPTMGGWNGSSSRPMEEMDFRF